MSKSTVIEIATGVGIVAVVLSIICLRIVKAHWNEHEATITVAKTERVNTKGSSYYLVYTKNSGVYTVQDSWIRWTFDSSDRYGMMEPNGRYTCTVVGWRWNMFTSYPNLLTVNEAAE